MAKEEKKPSKTNFHSNKRILETGATWLFLIGMRSNGKSYSVKRDLIEQYWKTKQKFIYLRRYDEDIKENFVTSYFDDMTINKYGEREVYKITGGKYIGIYAYHGGLYFYNFDDNDKIVRGEQIGRYGSLSNDVRFKSQVFTDYTDILYEEVIPNDARYLSEECERLEHFASTIFRLSPGRIWLIGNTLSRVSPYVTYFGLDKFNLMKPGQIDVYTYNQEDGTSIKLAVEYCEVVQFQNKVFIGKAKGQITQGLWEVDEMPKLPKKLEEYENVYSLLIEYMNFRFMLCLLVDNKDGGKICYIYPSTKDYHGQRVLTDRFSDNPFISSRLDLSKKPEQYIRECFAMNKLCYSDNLTGNDFKAVNEHFKIATLF